MVFVSARVFRRFALATLLLVGGGCPEGIPENSPSICERGEDDCSSDATCFASATDTFTCVCNDGFTGDGKTCTATTGGVCASNPCQNGGACTDDNGTATCMCPTGFSGDTCEVVAACEPNPCDNGGTCTAGGDGFVCSCPTGFGGVTCSDAITGCDPNPCQNDGTCDDSGGTVSCTCANGFEGTLCELTAADPCDPNPCLNAGTCADQDSGFECSCAPGFGGPTCATELAGCDPNPCANGGTCDDTGGTVVCECAAGYEGSTCAVNTDDCAAGPCLNGGTCFDLVDGYLCDCSGGYTGATCDLAPAPCDPNPCTNGGACAADGDVYICTCADGFQGPTCAVNTDDCAADPCENGATCYDLVDGYFCDCAAGFSGETCGTDVDDCEPNPCSNGGLCTDGVDSFTCACAAGFTGGTCDIDINECPQDAAACGNGYCVDAVNGYSCVCQAGWTGGSCDTDIDECASGPCAITEGCINTEGSYACYPAVFVREGADPILADGLSWNTAYPHPGDAVQAGAQVIWMSAGDYYLDDGPSAVLALGPDVQVYGGFDAALLGTDGDPATRDLVADRTYIYGDNSRAIVGSPGSRLDGLTVESGDSDDGATGGALLLQAADNSVLSDVEFINNTSSDGGGAIGCLNSDGVVLQRVHVYDNYSVNNGSPGVGGGGLHSLNCTITIKDSIFDSNRMTSPNARGGAIFAIDSTLTITGGAFLDNVAKGYQDAAASNTVAGGAIFATGTDLVIQGTTFTTNSAQAPALWLGISADGGTARGGAIYLDQTPSTSWSDVVLIGNATQGGHGATSFEGGFDGFECIPNDGGPGGNAFGGGLFLTDGVTLTMTGGQVLDNVASPGSGGAGGPAFDGCPSGALGASGASDGGGGYSADLGAITADVSGADAAGNIPNLWGPCPAGFIGVLCDQDIDECDPNPCVHGACTDGVATFSCACDPGWGGDLCDNDIDVDDCVAVECPALDEVCVDGVGVGVCTPVVMVDYGAALAGDGTTWESAYASIAEAIAAGAQAIWVKTATITAVDSQPMLSLPERTVIMGGFAAGLSNRDGDPDARLAADYTVLDGVNNAEPVVTVTERGGTLDGFVITNGAGNKGAGIAVLGAARARLQNLVVTSNAATGIRTEGAGLYCEAASDLRISGVTISNNTATGQEARGAGASFLGCTGAIDQSTISGNVLSAPEIARGGGLSVVAADIVVSDTSITGNSATATDGPWDGAYGGGAWIDSDLFSVPWTAVTVASNVAQGAPGTDSPFLSPSWYCSASSSASGGLNWCAYVGASQGVFGSGFHPSCSTSAGGGNGGPAYGGGLYLTASSVLQLEGPTIVQNSAIGGVGGAPSPEMTVRYGCGCGGSIGIACINDGSVSCNGPIVSCGSGPQGATGTTDGGGIYTSAAALVIGTPDYDTGGANVPNAIAPCPLGFTGPTCEVDIDECDPDPCQNGGTCTQGFGSYTCECAANWTGDNCEVFDCAVADCSDGDPCSLDSCDGVTGCSNGPSDLTDTDNDSVCNPADICPLDMTDSCETATANKDCVDVLAAGGTWSGSYWIDPDGSGPDVPWQAYCDQETNGGGWTLIIRQKQGGAWANWDFDFDPTQSAGTYVPDVNAADDFYREHADLTADQYMFRTGNGLHWLVTDTVFLDGPYENEAKQVMADSSGATDTAYLWYFRVGVPEDPWISLGDHAAPGRLMLYGENGIGTHSDGVKTTDGGVAVFVRALP